MLLSDCSRIISSFFLKNEALTLTVKLSEIQELSSELLLHVFLPENLVEVGTPCILISKAHPQQMLKPETDSG